MSCFDDERAVTAPGGRLFNWSRQVQVRPGLSYIPQTRAQLVASVRDAEGAGANVKAVGSAWSFEDIMTAGDGQRVIRTEGLNRVWLPHLDRAVRLGDGGLDGDGHAVASVSETSGVNHRLLHDVVRPDHPRREHVALVEGGVKLRWLNDWLWRAGRAMISAGGSAGQSMAGLIATGSHGGDLHIGPLPEVVLALHLVGANGQEHWIERASRPLSDPRRPERIRAAWSCDQIQVHHDDDLFNAVVMGLGRFGVLYAMVIEVRDQYLLTETASVATWSSTRARLARMNTSLLPRAGTGSRYLQIDLIPHRSGSDNILVLKQRTESPAGTAPPPRVPAQADFFNQLCTQNVPAEPVRAILVGAAAASGASTAGIAPLFTFLDLFAPGLGTTLAVGTAATGTVLSASLLDLCLRTLDDDTLTVVELLQKLVAQLEDAGLSWVARDILSALVLAMNTADGPTTSWSYAMMDTYNYGPQCFRVRSAEFVLPVSATDTRYLSLVDDIIDLATQMVDDGVMPPALVSLRFSAGSDALLSMHRAPLNCSIEVPVIQGFKGTDAFMEALHGLGAARGAISHWGQELRANKASLQRTFGGDLATWKVQLAKLVDARAPNTFSSGFTKRLGLEPDPTTLLRRALSG